MAAASPEDTAGLAAEGPRTGPEDPPAGLRTEEARVAERRVAAALTEEAEVRVAVAPVQAVPVHLAQGEAATANLPSPYHGESCSGH